MQMFHLYSDFDALIFKDNVFLGETNKVNGVHFKNSEDLNLLSVYALHSECGKVSVPYIINLKEVANLNNNSLVQVKKYSGVSEHAEFVLKENCFPKLNQQVVFLKEIYCLNESVMINVFCGYVSINQAFFYDLPFNVDNCEIKTNVVKNFIFLRYIFLNYEKIYVFKRLDDLFFLEFFKICKTFEIENEEIKMLVPCQDMNRQARVFVYKIEDEKIVETDCYYVALEKSLREIDGELIIYAFMENVIIGNFKNAKTYLGEELAKKLTKQHFKKFFEGITEIEQCKYSVDRNTLFGVFGDKAERMPFRFEIENGKIVNIN